MSSHRAARFFRRLALLVASALVGLMAASILNEPPALAPSAQAAPSSVRAPNPGYDLTSLEVMRQVVLYIHDQYVEPRRVNPREMFVAAMEAVEKNTPEVLVDGTAQEGRLRVTCNGVRREFDFSDLTDIRMLRFKLRPIFAFLQQNLVTTEDKREIEYAAINGLLSTLDPHSWLLKPDNYKEMKLQTRGEFGGLGFVISMDEDRLTVRKVLKNTPAARAGIRKGDHIARIDDESTINMELSEAVSRLRGKPATEVRLFVRRGEEAEKPYKLTRDVISVDSVTSRLLADGVGYARLSSFAGTTSRDLLAAIREMKSQAGGSLKGLVLDLRSNPGGLLDQAYSVADLFVESGAIVTTAGYNGTRRQKEPKLARNDGTDREFPLVVLVNPESASASEIVAGALKNLDRAVVVGRQTFGKGSVQVLYDIPEPAPRDTSGPAPREESALKLTIAQYLTPGERSIQEIGVVPDLELLPSSVTPDRVTLFAPPRLVREADLDKHFANGFAPTETTRGRAPEPDEKPLASLRYLRPEKPADTAAARKAAASDDEGEEEEPDEESVTADPQVEFSRQLLLRAPATARTAMLQAARPFLDEYRADQERRLQQSIVDLGLDWTASAQRPAGTGAVQATLQASPQRLVAGEEATLTLTVTNTGTAPLERLRAYTRCDAEKSAYQGLCALLERREFLLGKVAPGAQRRWSTKFKVPAHLPPAHESLTLVFQDAHGLAPAEQRAELETADARRPAFAFGLQVQDADNQLSPGETVDVEVTVRNTGDGPARNAFVGLRNTGVEKLFLKKGRAALGSLAPGESRTVVLSMELKPGFDAAAGLPLKVELGDRDLWEFATDKVQLPVAATPVTPVALTGTLRTGDSPQTLLSAPQTGAPQVARAQPQVALPVVARVGGFLKVEWSQGRFGYVAADAESKLVEGARPALPASGVEPLMHRDPPRLSFHGLDGARPLVVDAPTLHLEGVADDPSGLQDVRIFVDNEKVLFRGGAAGQPKPTRLDFAADVPLKPGNNQVLVLAREDGEFAAQKVLIVYRRPPAVGAEAKPALVK